MKFFFGSMVGCFISMVLGASSSLDAAQVTYTFTTTVSGISSAAPGFPASLAGVSVGTPISGTFYYDAATPAGINPSGGGIFGAATYYALNSPKFSFTIGGVLFNTWAPTLSAFVWNDYPTMGSTNYDGVLYTNFTNVGNTQFVLGELLLPTNAFNSTALPGGDLPGIYLLNMRQAGSSNWFDSAAFNLTRSFPGDINGDHVVEFSDLNTLLTNYGLPGTFSQGDFDGSGTVDFNDLNLLLTNYGLHAPLSSALLPVPEPGALVVAAIGVLGLLIAAWRRR